MGVLEAAADGRGGAAQNSDPWAEGDARGRFEGVVTAGDPASAAQETRVLERQQDLLEKLDRDLLPLGDFVTLEVGLSVLDGQLDEGTERVFAFLGKFHGRVEFSSESVKFTHNTPVG